MFRRHWRTVAAVILLSLAVSITLPQRSGAGPVAGGEAPARVQSEGRIPVSGGQSPVLAPTAAAPPVDERDEWRVDDVLSRGPRSETEPSPTVTPRAPLSMPASTASTPTRTAIPPTATPTRTAIPPTATPTKVPLPSQTLAPKLIGLQAGHWKYAEAPPPLNTMTGTSGGGKTEPEVTLVIANAVARILRDWGHRVDILPTIIPRGYKADLFVAIHADGSTNLGARGFFTDRPEGSPVGAAEARLSAAIDYEYAQATGIPYVNRSTPASHYYYGYREVASSVPRVLIETGFLTNAVDRQIIVDQPLKAAQGIASGIRRYLGR